MRKKRKLDAEREKFKKDLKAFAQQPLTQDILVSELQHRLIMSISSLENCIDKLRSLNSDESDVLYYTNFNVFDWLELGMNISAINNDIQDYVVEPLKRGCR